VTARERPSVFRVGAVSYLRIPAPDPQRLAGFYREVFGWQVNADRASFEDASGHVIGHFIPDLPVAGEAGIRPYVYVADVDETLARATSEGGMLSTPPYPEGDLRVATLRDPAGNEIGIWQRAAT